MAERPEVESKDTLSLELMGGDYLLEVRGKRDAQNEEVIIRYNADDFLGVVDCVLDYSRACVDAFRSPENSGGRACAEYIGSGSDRGKWFRPWMVDWELSVACALTSSHKKMLEKLVYLHNMQVLAIKEKEKIGSGVPVDK